MSTHNICFPEEVRVIVCEYPFFSNAVQTAHLKCSDINSILTL